MKEQRKAEPLAPFLHLESGWLPLQNLEPRPCNPKKGEGELWKIWETVGARKGSTLV